MSWFPQPTGLSGSQKLVQISHFLCHILCRDETANHRVSSYWRIPARFHDLTQFFGLLAHQQNLTLGSHLVVLLDSVTCTSQKCTKQFPTYDTIFLRKFKTEHTGTSVT